MKKTTFYTTMSVMWLGHFLVDTMLGIWPIYKTMVGLDLAVAGLISGVCAFFGEGLQLIFGHLSDRGYTKHLLFFGLLATISSTFLAFTTSYFYISLLFLLTCIGSGAFHPSAVSVVSNLSKVRKSFLIAFFASGGFLGLGLSQLIFAKCFKVLNGNTVWLSIPTILLLLFIVIFYQIPAREGKQVHEKLNLSKIRRFFRDRNLAFLYGNQVLNQAVFWGLIFLLPDILLARGYEDWIVYGGGHLFLIFGAAMMVVPAGYLADRYSCRSVIMASSLLSMSFYYLFLLYPDIPSPVLLTSLLFVGAAIGVVNPVGISLGNHLKPNDPGLVSGVLMGLVWCVAEFLGQTGGGMISKLFVENAAASAAAVLGVAFVISVSFASQLPSELPEEELDFAV